MDLRVRQQPATAQMANGFSQVVVALHRTSPGQFAFEDGTSRHSLKTQSPAFTVIPAHFACAVSWTAPCDSILLRIDPGYLEGIWAEIEGAPVDVSDLLPQAAGEDITLRQLGDAMVREAQTAEVGSRMYVDALGRQLALHLRRRFITGTAPRTGTIAPQTAAGIRRARAWLREHLGEDVSLSALAQVAGLSPFHFARCFRQATGFPPHQYLMRQRVRWAEALLRRYGRSRSLAQIAVEVGFCDQSHLTRHFKRLIGKTPAEFLR